MTPTGVLERFRLDSRVAVVTGAADGIGLAIAQALSAAGARVAGIDIVGARDGAPQADLVLDADVRDEEAVEAAFDRAEAVLGPVEIVFANAGVGGEAAFIADATTTGFRDVVETNLTGVFVTVRAAARRLVTRRRGSIVTTASLFSLRGDPYFGVVGYSAAKGGVLALTRTTALQLAPHGIRVNAVVPGYIRTKIGDGSLVADEPDALATRRAIEEATPLGRLGEPSDLQGIAVFLASDASSFCTGATFVVDGGCLAR